jgi:hypothetical protein
MVVWSVFMGETIADLPAGVKKEAFIVQTNWLTCSQAGALEQENNFSGKSSLPDFPFIDYLDLSHLRKNLDDNILLFPALQNNRIWFLFHIMVRRQVVLSHLNLPITRSQVIKREAPSSSVIFLILSPPREISTRMFTSYSAGLSFSLAPAWPFKENSLAWACFVSPRAFPMLLSLGRVIRQRWAAAPGGSEKRDHHQRQE